MQIERRCNRDISLPLHQILCSRDGVPHIDLRTWKMEAAHTDTAFSIDARGYVDCVPSLMARRPLPGEPRHPDAGVAFYMEWWCTTCPSTVAPPKIRPVELS
jgi:hypothetical protein